MPTTRRRRRAPGLLVTAAILLAAGALALGAVTGGASLGDDELDAVSAHREEFTLTPIPTPPPRAVPADPAPAAPVFDRGAHSTTDPASIWVVSNKSLALQPQDYAPSDLVYPDVPYVNRQPIRAVAAPALVDLFAAARKEAGLRLAVQSAYRSYETQVRVYGADVAAHGRAYADTDTARPGHSEHQTGLTVDVSTIPASCTLQACFGDTEAGRWLAANAWRYGFLLRYPADKVPVTGYTYEPWHFRYIGTDLAARLHVSGVETLEEFFDLPGGDYPDEG